jgi:hypothetical protein
LTNNSFASGSTTDGKLKKIYIGPIAPESFAPPAPPAPPPSEDEEIESVLSHSDHAYDAPPSSSSYNFLRRTDRMPKSWKDELQTFITETIDRHFEEREPVSSHGRKRKNIFSLDDDTDLESIGATQKQRKRPGKVEPQPSNEKSGNDSVSDLNLWPPHSERTRFQLTPSSIRFEQGSLSIF